MSANYDQYRRSQLLFLGCVALAAIVLIIGPLLLKPGPKASKSNIEHLLFFAAIGSGFMLIEVAFMQRMGLLLGSPGLSFAVVLAGLILTTGIGSLMSERRLFAVRGFRPYVVGIVVYTAAYLLTFKPLTSLALAWPLALKASLVVLIVAPAGWLMGHLMPRGLARLGSKDDALVAWAWAINGAAGTIAAGLAPILAQAWGFELLTATGALCYSLILTLPSYRAA